MLKTEMKIFLLFAVVFLFSVTGVQAGHVSCGQTITTDTVLDSDLINCPGNGLIIGASGITLDCNGHTVDGTGGNQGIYISNKQNVEIKNCNVRDFDDGIRLYSSSSGNTLTNNTANSNNKNGIILSSSSNNNILTDNTADSNVFYGIVLSFSSGNNTITGNTAQNNNYHGIYLSPYSNFNTLTGNIAQNNNYYGIYLVKSSNSNTLTNNTANSNGDYGIYLFSSSGNTLTSNTANLNDYGIIILGFSSTSNTLASNTADLNNYYGIYLASSDNTLTGNTANSNGQYGIRIQSSSNNALSSNQVCSNTLSDFNVTSSPGNSGTNNKCDNPDGWNDDGIVGCTYACSSPPPPTPVLLVHGYCSDPVDTWRGSYGFDFYQKLVDEGKEVYLIDYAPGECPLPYDGPGCANRNIGGYSNELKNRIEEIKQETGSQKVDVVAHSMGGLISRRYIQSADYRNDINQLIMVGTPNHGSQLSGLEWLNPDFMPLPFIGCAGTGIAADQMKPKSSFNSMLNYNIPEYNWTIWQSINEVVNPSVPYRNLAGTGELTFLLMKVPKNFPFENDGLDFTTTTWGDSVVATYHLRFINPSVGCGEFQGINHFQIHDNQNVFNSVLSFLNAPTQTQPDTCNYEGVPPGFTGVTEKQGFSSIISGIAYPNESYSYNITIDSTISESLFGLVWENGSSELEFTLITPSGNTIDENDPRFIGNLTGRKYYRIQTPEQGDWVVNIAGINVSASGEGYRIRASFLSSIYLQVESLNDEYSFDPGSSFEIIAYTVFNNSLIFPVNMTAEIINPDGSIDVIELFDDGLHGDYNASDGIYGNSYLPTILGDYEIFVTADGTKIS